MLGLLLCLGLGGYQGGKAGVAYLHDSSDESRVQRLIHDFGQDIVAGRFGDAYGKCDNSFHQLVPRPTFEGTWQNFNQSSRLGQLVGIEWNGLLAMRTDPISNQQVAGGLVLVKFTKSSEPIRTDMAFRQIDGTWMIDRIPVLFPPPAAPSAAPPGAPRSTSPQLMGPPRPI